MTGQRARPQLISSGRRRWNQPPHFSVWRDRDGYTVTEQCKCDLGRDHEEHEPPDVPPEDW